MRPEPRRLSAKHNDGARTVNAVLEGKAQVAPPSGPVAPAARPPAPAGSKGPAAPVEDARLADFMARTGRVPKGSAKANADTEVLNRMDESERLVRARNARGSRARDA